MRSKNPHPLKIWRLCQIPPLSQASAGRKLGLSDMAVSRFERGKFPEFESLVRIHRVTGLTPNDFFEPLSNSAQGKRVR